MKALPILAALGLVGLAGAFAAPDDGPAEQAGQTEQQGQTGPEESGGSCCSGSAKCSGAPLKANYLLPPELPAGVVSGKVTGRVLFDGELPEIKPLVITDEQSVGCTKDGAKVDAESRKLLVDEHLGIKNCVVSIEVPDSKLRVPEEPIQIDQVQCRFEPHVMVVAAGTVLEYLNSDDCSHNVHTFSKKNKPFNHTIPPGASKKQKVTQPEEVEIKCDLHPWMNAWLFVSGTNHAALTAADGTFSLEGLPPGKYRVTVWQEILGKIQTEVTVLPDGTSEPLEVKMKPRKKRGSQG